MDKFRNARDHQQRFKSTDNVVFIAPECLGNVQARRFGDVTLQVLIQIPILAVFQYDAHGIVLEAGTE